MNINIELISVGPLQQVEGKKYKVMEVAYKRDGKIEGKKLLDFAAKEAVKALQECRAGEFVSVELEKDQNGYWQWKSVSKNSVGSSGGGYTTANAGAAKPSYSGNGGSNYPTSEERAKQQTFIIRQSCLKAAVDYLAGKPADTQDIINIAKEFEHFVLTGKASSSGDPVQDLADFLDDIPL